MDECDVVVPRNRIADFIKATHVLAEELKVRIPSFGHAGDGNLHVFVCRDNLNDADWNETLAKAFDYMYSLADTMGGFVSGEHGIGYSKRKYLLRQYSTAQIELMRGIKFVFDPNDILNSGKIF